MALEPQEGSCTKEFKEYLTQGTLPEKEEDAEPVAGHSILHPRR